MTSDHWWRIRCVVDRLVGAVALVVLSPLVVVLAMMIRHRDGGPAFVRVARVGKDLEQFDMWKLRTMRADLPDGRASGSALTAHRDDRVTPLGVKIRAKHLDEIPQLVNVVRGEMTLLGPRPEAPDYVDPEDPRWQRLGKIPPGVAGPTQLMVSDWERHLIAEDPDNGAYVEKVLPVKLTIDEWYLDTASPSRDAEVATALLKRYLPGSQATRMRRRIRTELPEVAETIAGAPVR